MSTDILLLITRMNIGGPARQVLTLAEGLASDGRWRTVVAAGKPTVREGELSDPAVPVATLPLVRPVQPATDLRAFFATRRLLERTRPRVVHTHMAKAGALGRLAALRGAKQGGSRPRLIHTFHGHVLQGYFSSAQQQGFLRLERWLAQRTDALVAVSPEVRDELLDLGVGKPAQYRVLPLGLDLTRLLQVGSPALPAGQLRQKLGLPAGVPLAGVIGRLVPVKDHETLFNAVARVDGLHLAVLGDGELRASLEGLARELGIADRVHFTGWWPDVPAALTDLDVVVLSSRNEGTPVALIEALAAGRPVVATDVGGVRHVVQHGETGWLCAPGDPEALAGRIRLALTDRARAVRFGLEGRRRVSARFSLERTLADHFALYAELLPGDARGASGVSHGD